MAAAGAPIRPPGFRVTSEPISPSASLLSRFGNFARRASVRLFASLFLIYAFHAQEGWSTNSNRYLALAHSILLEGRLEIDDWRETTIDTARFEGHWYAGAAPGPALVALPVYALFRGAVWPLVPDSFRARVAHAAATRLRNREGGVPTGFDLAEFALSAQFVTLLVPPAVGALFGVLLFLFFRERVGERGGLLLALAISLGTVVFHYSTVLFSHVFTAAVAFGSLLLARRGAEPNEGQRWPRGLPFLSGLLAAATVGFDYLAAVASIALAAFALFRLPRRASLFFAAGAAGGAILLGAWHQASFGSPFRTPYSLPTGVEARDSHAPLDVGLFGMDRPRPSTIGELAAGPRRGYLLHMPILLAGLAGLFLALSGRSRASSLPSLPDSGPGGGATSAQHGDLPSEQEHGFTSDDRAVALLGLLLFAAFLLFNGSMKSEFYWLAGTSFGPRYLVPTIPFVAAGLAFLPWRRRATRWIVLPLAAVSILINWAGALFGASDTPFRFPLLDRFLPLFVELGPMPSLLRNLASLLALPEHRLVPAGWGATLFLALAVFLLLRPILRREPIRDAA
jgi:hypothetical protein